MRSAHPASSGHSLLSLPLVTLSRHSLLSLSLATPSGHPLLSLRLVIPSCNSILSPPPMSPSGHSHSRQSLLPLPPSLTQRPPPCQSPMPVTAAAPSCASRSALRGLACPPAAPQRLYPQTRRGQGGRQERDGIPIRHRGGMRGQMASRHLKACRRHPLGARGDILSSFFSTTLHYDVAFSGKESFRGHGP